MYNNMCRFSSALSGKPKCCNHHLLSTHALGYFNHHNYYSTEDSILEVGSYDSSEET